MIRRWKLFFLLSFPFTPSPSDFFQTENGTDGLSVHSLQDYSGRLCWILVVWLGLGRPLALRFSDYLNHFSFLSLDFWFLKVPLPSPFAGVTDNVSVKGELKMSMQGTDSGWSESSFSSLKKEEKILAGSLFSLSFSNLIVEWMGVPRVQLIL